MCDWITSSSFSHSTVALCISRGRSNKCKLMINGDHLENATVVYPHPKRKGATHSYHTQLLSQRLLATENDVLFSSSIFSKSRSIGRITGCLNNADSGPPADSKQNIRPKSERPSRREDTSTTHLSRKPCHCLPVVSHVPSSESRSTTVDACRT